MMQHGTYDAYWKARNLLPHFKDIRPAMLTVGGWFDAEDFYGPLHIFKTIEQGKSRPRANYLVVGPWPHGGWAGGDRQLVRRHSVRQRDRRHLPRRDRVPVLQPLSER